MDNFKNQVAYYISSNSDRPIQEVYDELKSKKKLSKVERVVYIFLKSNIKKLGIKK